MKDYRVIMLGPSGSGKTVFLASMYKQLAIFGDSKFFLEVESGKNRKRLNSLYMEIATGDTWPQGTKRSKISKWKFICKVQTPNLDIYPACQFTYIDYAGGLVTDELEEEDNDPVSADFDDELKNADSFLGLLDGQKIYDLMSGGEGREIFLYKDLPNMLPILNKCSQQNPVHFVISKWDLLEKHYSIDMISERLLSITDFRNLVQNRIHAGSQVRLIPVSSIGSNFAIPQSDGSMKKVSGNLPEPFQVEMPVACVLPAKFRHELANLKNDKIEELSRKIEINLLDLNQKLKR
ncbi:MAG: hypothetical protein AAGE84_11600 [Cyanobacteria bacterium P01_G01_bin.39]